jgi:hypothetical protein
MALDAGGKMTTPEELAAQDAAKKAQDAKDAEAAQAAAEAERLAAEEEAKAKLTADDYKAMLDKATKDRSAANKAEIAAKKERDALAAKVKKYEDEKKTEAEKLEARAKEAEEAAAAAKAEALTLRHKGYAQDAGVLPQYRDYAVSEFAKEENADPAEWFKSFKESHPAMFNGKEPATKTAVGGPNAPTKTDPYAAQIAEHEEDLKKERDPNLIPALKRSLRYLKKKQAETKGA